MGHQHIRAVLPLLRRDYGTRRPSRCALPVGRDDLLLSRL